MSKSQRTKGRLGQSTFAHLLRDRDWQVIETSSGMKVEDIIAESPDGQRWSVEVKNCKSIDIPRYKKQAMEQALRRKLSWMLACRIHGSASWIVWRKGEQPVIWTGKEAACSSPTEAKSGRSNTTAAPSAAEQQNT